jgi:hypothetical protein
MSPLFLSACRGRSMIYPSDSHVNLRAPVGFMCTLIVIVRKLCWSIPTLRAHSSL